MILLLQLKEIVEIAEKIISIEYVSGVGLMLLICVYFFLANKKLMKNNEEKDIAIRGFIEKYYVIATELKEKNKNVSNQLDVIVEELKRR